VPSIRIHESGEVFQTGILTSLLNTLLANGFPIETLCGGRAECGKCLIRVLSGAEQLSAVHPKERQRLDSLGVSPGMRLACQCYSRGDVEIEVINRRGL
jgi:ferredoxin